MIDTHPSQYSSPFYEGMSAECDEQFRVIFLSDFSNGVFHDSEFNAKIEWDSDLLSGFPNEVLKKRDHTRSGISFLSPFISWKLINMLLTFRGEKKILVTGWNNINLLIAIILSGFLRWEVFFRAETYERAQNGLIPPIVRKFVLKLCLGKVKRFFYIGESSRRFYSDYLGIGGRYLRCSPYCVDNKKFGVEQEREKQDSTIKFLFVSKMSRRKRVIDLLIAFFHSDMYKEKTGMLTLVGVGEELAEVKALVLRMRVQDSVKVLGFVNQTALANIYASHDVFVLPSEFDTWGLVVNEAMAAGCAVIVSDGCGCAEDLVLEGDPNGFSYRAGDVGALRACLDQYVDPELLKTHKHNSLTKIADFDAHLVGANLARDLASEGAC